MRFAENKIVMVAIKCLEDCPVVNTPLAQLTESSFPDLPSTVVGVVREGKLFVPHSSDQLITGDLAYVATTNEQVRRTLGLFGHDEEAATRIVIAGGGKHRLYVARTIEARQNRTRIKIIEHSRDRAVTIADELRRTVVLHGSALDQKLLMEADIQEADLMIALTNDDQSFLEVNILSSVIAKQLGCKSNLTLLNNPRLSRFCRHIGHRRPCEPAQRDHLAGPAARAPGPHPRCPQRPEGCRRDHRGGGAGDIAAGWPALAHLDLPEGMRLGAIYRDGQVLKTSGDLKIKPKDRVVIFAMAKAGQAGGEMFPRQPGILRISESVRGRMPRIAYVNGRYVPHGSASVHIEDRGYQFADGVYEVCEVAQGFIVDMTRHLDRLDHVRWVNWRISLAGGPQGAGDGDARGGATQPCAERPGLSPGDTRRRKARSLLPRRRTRCRPSS